ncbi:hypothetical protein TIFTF001_002192 [Ficus carica]|uniref:Uncharacterized protein n=1 Tax=Ficus carica TaxID=3494 RepID=A0AA87Z2T8_FICCA|nr:hypothetical protein TIFTF001_002192 [Ficus carica]
MGRLLGVEVIVGLGGLRFSKMEEGKDRGFNGTFRDVVVIFLSTAFQVLSLIIRMVFQLSGLVVCLSDLDLDDSLVLLDLWLYRVFGDLYDVRSWLPVDRQFPSLVGALLSRAWYMLVSGVSKYIPVFGPQTYAFPTVRQLFVSMVEGYDRTIVESLHCIVQFVTLH